MTCLKTESKDGAEMAALSLGLRHNASQSSDTDTELAILTNSIYLLYLNFV